jgi:phosphoglycolate phosphatase
MNVKAVVFDLDGTLLDTLEDIADSANGVLTGHGCPAHPIDAYRHFVGDGIGMLMRRVLPSGTWSEDEIMAYTAEFRDAYGRNWNAKTKPYDGVPEMLDEVTARRLKRAVLSNKPDDFTQRCVTELLPKWTFDWVLGLHSGIPAKPDPTGALQTATQLNVSPEHILYLGDSAVDMQTAVASGMYPVGALWGFRAREELLDGGAEAVIAHPKDLLALF